MNASAAVRQSGPAAEPITLAEAKAQCRIDVSDDDTYVTSLIVAARAYIEGTRDICMVNQVWDFYFDGFCDPMQLTKGPVSAITEFEYAPETGAVVPLTISSGDILSGSAVVAHIDLKGIAARVVLAGSAIWPTATLKPGRPVRIEATVGYGADGNAVPADLKHAMKLLISHWYTNRDAVTISDRGAVESRSLPLGFEAIMAAHTQNVYA